MKGKVTSLVLVGGAFAVAALTQDSSPNLLVGSRVLTALITTAWFGAMGTGLYFWSKYSRQETSQGETNPVQANKNPFLQKLAAALGQNKGTSVTEIAPNSQEVVYQEDSEKVSR